MAPPSLEEIYEVISSLDAGSTSGLDGFNGHLYVQCWELIKLDIREATKLLFAGFPLPTTITSTRLILILTEYHPISFCNYYNKIMLKLIANMLADVLPSIISPAQSGFVRGQDIDDNIVLVQEMIADLGHKHQGGNITLKLDMLKAYDRLD